MLQPGVYVVFIFGYPATGSEVPHADGVETRFCSWNLVLLPDCDPSRAGVNPGFPRLDVGAIGVAPWPQ